MNHHDNDNDQPATDTQPYGEAEGFVRETYEEYALAGDNLGMIADPENPRAWIQTEARHVVRIGP